MHSTFAAGRCWPVLVLVTATVWADARGADSGPPVTFEDNVAVILPKNWVQRR